MDPLEKATQEAADKLGAAIVSISSSDPRQIETKKLRDACTAIAELALDLPIHYHPTIPAP